MAELVPRRRFLGATFAVAGAVLLGGCREDPDGNPTEDAAAGRGPNAGDLDLLVALGQIEQTLARAFTTIAEVRTDDLAGSGLGTLADHHGQRHREHTRVLADVIEAAGADAIAVATDFPGMAVPTSRDLAELPIAGLLGILARCEAAAAATAADAVGRLSLAELRGPVAGLGAADAGLGQTLQLATGGGLAELDHADLVDGLLPLDRSYLAG